MNICEHILYHKILTSQDAFNEIIDVFKRILEEKGIALNTRRFRKMVKGSCFEHQELSREDKFQILTIATFLENFSNQDVLEYINLAKKEKIAREIMRCLDEERKDVSRICELLVNFHRIPAGKIHLSTTMTLDIRVNLISQFISSHLAYFSIAKNYINMRDIATVLERSISSTHNTGLIGGKAAGMILANRIIRPTLEAYDNDFDELIEEIDSYYVKSSIINEFTYLNKLEECHSLKYLEGDAFEVEREKLYKRFMDGRFSENTINQFKDILKKCKGSPLILRSSSFLEDSVGCSFTGKYDSFFISNSGTMDERLAELTNAIKQVYFSLYSASVIQYRKDRKLLDYNERMSVLIQKVVGTQYGKYFFPAIGIVGFSRNAYCWNKRIKPEDGMLRMVMGLGTRAVDRVGDDYPRLVSLSAPMLRPEVTNSEKIKYSQKYVDVLNLETKQIETKHFVDLVNEIWQSGNQFDIKDLISLEQNGVLARPMFQPSKLAYNNSSITIEGILNNKRFTSLIGKVLKRIEKAYAHPVDMEFAYNNGKLYILQCRTLSERISMENVILPEVEQDDLLFKISNVATGAIVDRIKYIVYIDQNAYNVLPKAEDKYEIARTIGKINKELEKERFILMAPGRWGSSDINLGIPVKYGDINHTLVLIEMGWQKQGVTPELSFGTHFFQDLVEADIIPLALFPEQDETAFKADFFVKAQNCYNCFSSLPKAYSHVIKIIKVPCETSNKRLSIYLDGTNDQGVAVFE